LSGKSDRKIAFAATKEVGSSVIRHLHIRKMRELYRLNKDLFDEHGHYFLLARAEVKDWGEFENRLKAMLKKVVSSPPVR
jgi:RNase P protein component